MIEVKVRLIGGSRAEVQAAKALLEALVNTGEGDAATIDLEEPKPGRSDWLAYGTIKIDIEPPAAEPVHLPAAPPRRRRYRR